MCFIRLIFVKRNGESKIIKKALGNFTTKPVSHSHK